MIMQSILIGRNCLCLLVIMLAAVLSSWSSISLAEQMPTFNEFHQKALLETNVNSGGTRNSLHVSPNLQKNAASPDCGSKVHAANEEAKNVAALLSDNRDDYMKNLCTANKWLDLELCEPLQIRLIELANFELFSSSFKNFTVSTSESYPSQSWNVIANLTLNSSRVPQTFELFEVRFVKFVRLNFSDHYGSEHFCTLSSIRVFGLLTSDLDSDSDLETIQEPPTAGLPMSPVNGSSLTSCGPSTCFKDWLMNCQLTMSADSLQDSASHNVCIPTSRSCSYFNLFRRSSWHPLHHRKDNSSIPNMPSQLQTSGYTPLANKIKQIHKNVTVSMRYLEELSLSYNRQMERLSRHFNLTLRRLQDTANSARARDREQSARIRQLEIRCSRDFSSLILWHIIFIVIETLIFLACCSRVLNSNSCTVTCQSKKKKKKNKNKLSNDCVASEFGDNGVISECRPSIQLYSNGTFPPHRPCPNGTVHDR